MANLNKAILLYLVDEGFAEDEESARRMWKAWQSGTPMPNLAGETTSPQDIARKAKERYISGSGGLIADFATDVAESSYGSFVKGSVGAARDAGRATLDVGSSAISKAREFAGKLGPQPPREIRPTASIGANNPVLPLEPTPAVPAASIPTGDFGGFHSRGDIRLGGDPSSTPPPPTFDPEGDLAADETATQFASDLAGGQPRDTGNIQTTLGPDAHQQGVQFQPDAYKEPDQEDVPSGTFLNSRRAAQKQMEDAVASKQKRTFAEFTDEEKEFARNRGAWLLGTGLTQMQEGARSSSSKEITGGYLSMLGGMFDMMSVGNENLSENWKVLGPALAAVGSMYNLMGQREDARNQGRRTRQISGRLSQAIAGFGALR